MSRIVVFGGSFNPIHEGHLKLMEDAYDFVDADKVILVPNRNHPFKGFTTDVTDVHILNMLKMAISSSIIADCIEIDSFELENSNRVCYTYHTIKYLSMKHPNSELVLLVGTDNLKTLTSWHNFSALKEMVTFVAGKRKGFDTTVPADVTIALFDTDAPNVSSTQLREKVENGEDISSLVDLDVASYIRVAELYK